MREGGDGKTCTKETIIFISFLISDVSSLTVSDIVFVTKFLGSDVMI